MTDAWDFDETDNQNLNNGPKPLRDAYEAQKKANKELMDRLAKLEAESTKNRVADLIESQGVPRNAAQFYNGDPDPEKVSSWVNDMRTTFGGAVASSAQSIEPAISSDDQARLQRLMQAGADGATPGNYEAANAAMFDAESTADRIAAWQNFARTAQQ
jgi:hypothetical protein